MSTNGFLARCSCLVKAPPSRRLTQVARRNSANYAVADFSTFQGGIAFINESPAPGEALELVEHWIEQPNAYIPHPGDGHFKRVANLLRSVNDTTLSLPTRI